MMRNRVFAILCVVVLLGALAKWTGGSGSHGAAPESVTTAQATSAVVPAREGASGAGSGSERVETDMLGTKLDAARLFDLGFAGGLTIDRDTRAALEALSMAMPDQVSAAEIDKLETTLRQGLPREDAEKAIKLFHDYRSYLTDMKAELPALGLADSQEASQALFDRVTQVQRKHFDDATAAALFGQDVERARLASLASLINRDADLSPTQKKEQLDALRALLPADLQNIIVDGEAEAPVIHDEPEPIKR